MTDFDLIIIGSGSGNTVITDAMAGWRIAIVEESTFGGTCLNVGCIPTKMYVHAADIAATTRDSSRFGVDTRFEGVRWPDIRDRIFGHIDPKSAGGERHRRFGENTTLFDAHAHFSSWTTVRLSTGESISGPRIVVATGARATAPDVVTRSGVPFHTSDTIMRIADLPEHLVIIGGGYIAAEFAHIFSSLGSRVTLVVRGSRLLAHADADVSRHFTELVRRRWDVHLNVDISAVHAADGGVSVDFASGGPVSGDLLLVATGRIPNSDHLDLDAAGVKVGDDGLIVVDQYQRTTAEGIWALGDVSAPRQRKHVGNQDARVVAHNLVHPHDLRVSNHEHIPDAVFTDPQLASVGLTEAQAHAAGLDFVTATQAYAGTAFGWALEDTTSLCKLLADRVTGRLLGAHLMGPQASVLIQPLIQAMVFDQRVGELAQAQYWIHPALTEVVENALIKVEAARTS